MKMNPVAIQIMRRQLGLNDARYRDILLRTSGVSSSKELTDAGARKVYKEMCRMAQASTPSARYVWVLWTQLQPFLPAKERNGAYLAGWIRRCAPMSDLADLSDLSRQTPATLHKVIESLKVRLDNEKKKMADVPF